MPGSRVFLTGGTGYVGGKLLAALRERDADVRALSRSGDAIDGAEVWKGDVRDGDELVAALEGSAVAYYLVHSLGEDDFGSADREAALSFAEAAATAGAGRIVYLGGIGRGDLSPHLASRQEVGRILRDSGVPTVELRASIVLGEGSVSFDAFRSLAAFPVAVLPDWVDTPSQPIAVDDVVSYLLEAAEIELDGSAVYEIGGADKVPYRAILDLLGDGVVVQVPAPDIVASLATALKPLQPERARVVSDLIETLRNDTSVHDDTALRVFSVRPRGLADAIRSS